MNSRPTSPIILALDVPSGEEALRLVQLLCNDIDIFKVGMQLFYREGQPLVQRIRDMGKAVFLDLKLHDIPNTVSRACESLRDLEPHFLTLHLTGGRSMIEAAQAAFQETETRLLGITVLTSLRLQQLQELYPGLSVDTEGLTFHLAALADQCHIAGVVCSAHENRPLRQAFQDRLCLVNPGVRPMGTSYGDQHRVMTPRAARDHGGDYLVMGRPILEAADPRGMVERIHEEIGYAVGVSTGSP